MEVTKKLIMAAWEIGHHNSPCGVKVGGMAGVLEELPNEMAKYAAQTGLPLEIEVLSPCFRFYDRSKMDYQGKLNVPEFGMEFDVFSYVFEDGAHYNIKHVYFWNEALMGSWGDAGYSQSIYPSNGWNAIRIYARVAAAMANYIKAVTCHAIHLHDYHVGMIPFYLDMETLRYPGLVFTIHNASYQGWLEIWNDPSPVMYELAMPLAYYYEYFQHWGNFNTMKGVLLRIPEIGGVVTTVSEGYAQELYWSADDIRQLAMNEGYPFPQQVFVPSNGLSEFGEARVQGINNGLSQDKHPENLKYLKARELRKLQEQENKTIFHNFLVQEKMLREDHNYSLRDLANRAKLREYLCLECFDAIPEEQDIIFCAVGRLVEQKNFNVLLWAIEPILHHNPQAHFIILATPVKEDQYGQSYSKYFAELAQRNPDKVYFSSGMHEPLGKLVLAGSDFCIIPSRFEPCGLVDYEAAVLGNIPIVRKTGGLVKTLPHAYSYSWYDEEDPWGEVFTLQKVIGRAIDDYLNYPVAYQRRMQNCMQINTSWEKSVAQYFNALRL